MKLTEETIIQRNPDILASDIDGEKVMMSIQQGEYYGLGKTGSFIWDHIEQPISIKDLADLITEKYEVGREQCLQDILPFLNDLAEKKLIVAIK
ncbi:MAG: lasso peptide biosynthesis PqqD family chaperone [Bacteroidota bacterium]|nr:lasso peptide biosynthesis PqqD family chaperone [Bacteroidota bacterium]